MRMESPKIHDHEDGKVRRYTEYEDGKVQRYTDNEDGKSKDTPIMRIDSWNKYVKDGVVI
jgi:hypothetical protein